MNYLTAGESHGPQLTGIIEGLPAGLKLDIDAINAQLAARQGGYGRGSRQKIEHDTVQIVGGVRHSITMGGPIALVIQNRDHGHWGEIMSPTAEETPENTLRQVTRPRPGHADLVGGQKYGHHDMRNVLERSSDEVVQAQLLTCCQCWLLNKKKNKNQKEKHIYIFHLQLILFSNS